MFLHKRSFSKQMIGKNLQTRTFSQEYKCFTYIWFYMQLSISNTLVFTSNSHAINKKRSKNKILGLLFKKRYRKKRHRKKRYLKKRYRKKDTVKKVKMGCVHKASNAVMFRKNCHCTKNDVFH